MDDSDKSSTADNSEGPPAPAKPKPATGRDERLAARLRENLRKRKEQARQRGDG